MLKSVGLIAFFIPGLDGAPNAVSSLSNSEVFKKVQSLSLSDELETSKK